MAEYPALILQDADLHDAITGATLTATLADPLQMHDYNAEGNAAQWLPIVFIDTATTIIHVAASAGEFIIDVVSVDPLTGQASLTAGVETTDATAASAVAPAVPAGELELYQVTVDDTDITTEGGFVYSFMGRPNQPAPAVERPLDALA